MFIITARMGQLTVNGQNSMLPMLKWSNLHLLRDFGTLVGDDTRVAGGGFVLNPRRFDGLDVDLLGELAGDVDNSGTPVDDGVDGWLANETWVRANLTDPPSNADQTVDLTLVWGGLTYTALGRIGPLITGDIINANTGNVKVSCPLSLPLAPFVAS